MKTKKLIFIIAILVPCIILHLSCQKEDIDFGSSDGPNYEQSEVNIALEELVGYFLEALDSKSFREELRKEALIEYDDDYVNKMLIKKSSETDNQILRLLFNYSKDLNFERLQELVNKIPNYEVSIPVNCEEWDPINYKPLIAYIPSDFNENVHNRIKAFDNFGNTIWLKIKSDPDLPVILIRPKEDIDLTKYLPDNGLDLKVARINRATEFIKTIRTPDIGAVESWITGPRCEVKVVTISSKMQGIWSIDYFNPKRDDINNRTETVNHNLGVWNTIDIGQYLTMQWYEEDGGGTVTTSISYKTESGYTSTVSYSIKDEDDNLGFKTVNYIDPVGIEYNTGKWQWKMHNSTYCPIIGSWDGANCYIGNAPSGRQAYIYNNKFYYTVNFSNNPPCPILGSYFDGTDCYLMSIPTGLVPFVYNNSWYVQPYSF